MSTGVFALSGPSVTWFTRVSLDTRYAPVCLSSTCRTWRGCLPLRQFTVPTGGNPKG